VDIGRGRLQQQQCVHLPREVLAVLAGLLITQCRHLVQYACVVCALQAANGHDDVLRADNSDITNVSALKRFSCLAAPVLCSGLFAHFPALAHCQLSHSSPVSMVCTMHDRTICHMAL
jgi:hypothetical protein